MPSRPRTVFLGTPAFAVPSLKTLIDISDVRLVVTQPDRPSGRGRKVLAGPVKQCAIDHAIEVIQPATIKGRRFAQQIAELEPDFLVTAAFGRLLGRRLLAVPHKASLNVHASLLPRHRGAAPINWSILAGDRESGVSVMQMAPGLDTGPVYLEAKLEIGESDTAGELTARLAELGARALRETIERFDQLTPSPQDESLATWAPMLKKSDGEIDWTRSARELHNRVRGLHPWPTATARWGEQRLKIHRTQVISDGGADSGLSGVEPGTIVAIAKNGIDVACGNGIVRLVELQAPGKKRLGAEAFLRGTPLKSGQKLH